MNFKNSFRNAGLPLVITAGLVSSHISPSVANDSVPKTNPISMPYGIGTYNCAADGSGGYFFYKDHADGLLGYSFKTSADDGREIKITPLLSQKESTFRYKITVQGDPGIASVSELQVREIEQFDTGAEKDITGTAQGGAIEDMARQSYLVCKTALSLIGPL